MKDCEEELAHDEAWLGTRLEGRAHRLLLPRRRREEAAHGRRRHVHREAVAARGLRAAPAATRTRCSGHEIAHVVAGSFARGPFRVAGALGGWWPNPGLIEGVAVAASPDDDELTGAQWARAMIDLGTPAADVAGLLARVPRASRRRRATRSPARSSAGVLRSRREATRARAGTAARRSRRSRARAGPRSTRSSARGVARRAVPPGGAVAYAKARFERPSVFGARARTSSTRCEREANGCRGRAQDRSRDDTLYDDVLARDPHDWGAMLELGVMELRYGDGAAGERDARDARQGRAGAAPVARSKR